MYVVFCHYRFAYMAWTLAHPTGMMPCCRLQVFDTIEEAEQLADAVGPSAEVVAHRPETAEAPVVEDDGSYW